ncbi:integumentary mucin C.1 isoform X1 [Drosophila montana]|uniref:integumentary mucin C.1 isoform X1 n=1 Tax=Drosophila montana TaxID=40370 RepID=UPI00313CF9FC
MNVLPVLLLLVQLTAMVLAGTNQTATGSPASANVTKLAMVSPSSNATAKDAGVGSSAITVAATANQSQVDKDKPAKVNGTEEHAVVLVRGVTNTDTATVQAAPKANATATTTQAPQVIKSTATTAITKQTNPTAKTDKMLADGVSLSDINKNKNKENNNSNSSSTITTPAANINSSATNSSSSSTNVTNASTTTTTTSTTTTTTTTTSTTTMRPKKPTVTSSMDKQLEGEKLDPAATGAGNVAPHVLPVQELSSSLTNRGENEYIVPIVTIMLAVPLAIAVFIIMYRRFRDLWTTRHYRRMDFLVDGMYND